MKLILPPQPDPAILAAAVAESDAANEALTIAKQVAASAYARVEVAERAKAAAKAPEDYVSTYAALVAEAKQPGNTLVAKPIRKWDGATMEIVGHEIACVMPGKIQCRGRRLSNSGSVWDETFYRRDGGRWATSRRAYDDGEWYEVTS